MGTASQLLPLAWILGGILAGAVAYALVVRPMHRTSTRHGWFALEAAMRILGSVVVLWGALAGLYLGLDRVTLTAREATFLNRAIGALFVFSLMWIAARIAAASIEAFGRRSDQKLFSVSLYSTLAQVVILVIGLLTVLSSLGIAIAPLLTTLGLGGFAVALALNDTLSNLFAGIQIVAAKQLRVGDFVTFEFADGQVTDINWHNTSIRDAQNNVVVVPNSKINTTPFTNYSVSQSGVLPLHATVPWKGRFEVLREVAEHAARDVAAEFGVSRSASAGRVYLTGIADTGVQVTALLPLAGAQDRMLAQSAFLQRLRDRAVDAES